VVIRYTNGGTLEPFDHPYNTTALNERAVELAMAREFLLWRSTMGELGRCLEVGNVLSHYEDSIALPSRRVVDRFEEAPNVENIDVFDIEGTYDTIISISTIEHVGRDDGRDRPHAAVEATYHLRSLLAPGGRFFCTFPTGWNEALDAVLGRWPDRARHGHHYFVRDGRDWVEDAGLAGGGYKPRPYGQTQFWADGVFVAEFGPSRRVGLAEFGPL
jgi:SAM-dependent methyltransferase